MNITQKHTLLALACFMGLPIISYSQMTPTIDEVLKKADLDKLIGSNQSLNLIAQPLIPGKTTNVNAFNDFFAIGTIHTVDGYTTTVVEFDKDHAVLSKVTFKKPWGGVAPFTQNEIPTLSLQDGLIEVQRCMQQKGIPIPSSTVTNVILYKTLYPGQMIYDYSFSLANDTQNCQEVLYIPAVGDCMLGSIKACHIKIKTLSSSFSHPDEQNPSN